MTDTIKLAKEAGALYYEYKPDVPSSPPTYLRFYPDQLDAFVSRIRAEAMEEDVKLIEGLIREHCLATKQSTDPLDHCQEQGGDGCEFVDAWNDAIAAIRSAASPKT